MDDSYTFQYQWMQHVNGVALRIDSGTFSIPYESYELLDSMSNLDSKTVNSRYGARITLGKLHSIDGQSKIVLSLFDAWGETVGIYFLPVDVYDELILSGYVALAKNVKI